MVGQSHSTVEIGQCRWREGDCIVKVLLRTHYPYSGTEEIMETKLVRIA
ncbi:group II intron reverse transcriptase/maturase, partial [Mediterraneibacter gnavus]